MICFKAFATCRRSVVDQVEAGHGWFLWLQSEDSLLSYEIPETGGTFLHLSAKECLRAAWRSARDRAFLEVGSLKPLGVIELDEYELSYLVGHRA